MPTPPRSAPADSSARAASDSTGADAWREESWFAALGLQDSTRPQSLDDGATAEPRSRAHKADGRQSGNAGAPSASQRIYNAFSLARALLGLLMLATQLLLNAFSAGRSSLPVLLLCVLYLAATWSAARRPLHQGRAVSAEGWLRHRWFAATVALDLATFGLLMFMAGPGLNVAALFALPVLMGAALCPRRVALAVAAIAALLLLAGATVQAADGDLTAPFMQAGLAGAGLFAIAVLTGELAARLAREERAARSTLAVARQQVLLNRLVIEEMQDGVLVADRDGQVRAANPAALGLIGLEQWPRGSVFSLREVAQLQPLVAALEQAYAAGTWPDGGRDITLRMAPSSASASPRERTLRLRVRFARPQRGRERDIAQTLCVLLLEDVRTLRARARQEKLAAMGRVSAGIAHEIRNPLAAIAQASELLAEDLTDPSQRKLAAIVADNVERLRRIVNDVMAAAPGGAHEPAPLIDLMPVLTTCCTDWLRTNRLPAGAANPLALSFGTAAERVSFDPDHLRRVVVNLLDNAWRHGSRGPGSVGLRVEHGLSQQVHLLVTNDGPPIDADVERHLFEPFFSTRSRGSGLGLYICRELCARHGAGIEYRNAGPNAAHMNVFVVSLPAVAGLHPSGPEGPDSLHAPSAFLLNP